jgi:hypothetical protein
LECPLICPTNYNWAYNPGTTEIYWEKVISSSVVLIGLLSFMIYNQGRVNRRTRERNDFPRYTIGLTLGSHNNVKGSKTIEYKYYVNGIMYTTTIASLNGIGRIFS